jgi:hypothetical protein
MPFVANQDEDELQQQQQGQQPQSSEQVLSSAPGGTLGGGTAAASASGGSGASGRRSSFTNLQSYLNANRGQNAQGLADKVSGAVENTVSGAQQNLNKAQQSFNQGVQGSGVTNDQNLINSVAKDPRALNNGDAKSRFQSLYNAVYQGPQDLSEMQGFGEASQGFNKVQDQVKNLGDQSGRQALIQDAFKRPDYSAGQKSLDSYIFGTTDEGRGAINNLQGRYSNIADSVGIAANQARQAAQQRMQETEAARSGAMGAVQQGNQILQQQLQQQAAQRNAERDANYAKFLQDNARYHGFIGPKARDASIEDVAGPEDRAAYEALREMAGEGMNWLGAMPADALPSVPANIDLDGYLAQKQETLNKYGGSALATLNKGKAIGDQLSGKGKEAGSAIKRKLDQDAIAREIAAAAERQAKRDHRLPGVDGALQSAGSAIAKEAKKLKPGSFK